MFYFFHFNFIQFLNYYYINIYYNDFIYLYYCIFLYSSLEKKKLLIFCRVYYIEIYIMNSKLFRFYNIRYKLMIYTCYIKLIIGINLCLLFLKIMIYHHSK